MGLASRFLRAVARHALETYGDGDTAWNKRKTDEDPDRVETVYTMRTRDGGRIEVTWHDGNAKKWQWFYTPAGGEEPTTACERLFESPGAAKLHAETWAMHLR